MAERRPGRPFTPADKENIMPRKAPLPKGQKPDPERVEALRSLPLEIKQQITGEEARAFLYNEPLPDSLIEKLKDYLVDDEAG